MHDSFLLSVIAIPNKFAMKKQSLLLPDVPWFMTAVASVFLTSTLVAAVFSTSAIAQENHDPNLSLKCNDVSLGSDTREGIKVEGANSDTRRGGTVVRGQNCDTANQGQLMREAMQMFPRLIESMGKMMEDPDDQETESQQRKPLSEKAAERETYNDCLFFNGPQACEALKPSSSN